MKCFQVHNREERTVVFLGTLYELRRYMQECAPASRTSVRVTEREVKIDKASILEMINALGRPVYDASVPSRLFVGTAKGGLKAVDAFPAGERYDTGPVAPAEELQDEDEPVDEADPWGEEDEPSDDTLEAWTADDDEEDDWS